MRSAKGRDPDRYNPPETSGAEGAQAMIRAGVGMFPIVGQLGAELVQELFNPIIKQRQREWQEQIAQGLRDLEDRGFTVEELLENDLFVDAVMQSATAAVQTSQVEKREALYNAMRNTVLPTAPKASWQRVFLSYVESFTDWHIRILRLFDDPSRELQRLGVPQWEPNSLADVLLRAYPELRDERPFYDYVWKDLNTRALINTPSMQTMMTGRGCLQQRTTQLGQQFLAFISEPPAPDE